MNGVDPIILPVDGVNVSRGADQTIVYTAAYGASTSTNEYGYEIVVQEGMITRLGGNDSTIPGDGFVVSLHGATMTAVRTQVTKGMTVQYDEAARTVTFAYSVQGVKRAVARALDSAQRQVEQAQAAFVYADYETIQAQLDAVRNEALALSETDAASMEYGIALIDKAEVLCRKLCDSYSVHYRGVWIRPSQKDAAEVEAYVRTLHEARINFVCIEGWFANGVIMKLPEDSLFSPHPQFDYDVLQAYVEACHKYGVECHLWMPILCVGSFYDNGYENTPAGRRPEWMSLSNRGDCRNPNGFMMLDPANEEACAYLLEVYRYIVTNYDIDGFEMDYIRYYAASDEDDYGYTPAAFAGFEKAYGHGVTPVYDREADWWNDWCQYRRDCITKLVRRIREMLDREAPDVLLAADVAFPFSHALHTVYQNFPQWLEEGILDILHPMAYGDGYENDIRKAVALAGDRCMVVTGLGAQGDLLRTEELERQSRENATYGAFGECYFEADAYFYKHLPPAVMEAVYRREAIPPFLHVADAVCESLSYMLERVDKVIVPRGGMDEAQASAVRAAAQTVTACMREEREPFAAIAALKDVIASIGNADAVRALRHDLYRTQHILCVKHRRKAIGCVSAEAI